VVKPVDIHETDEVLKRARASGIEIPQTLDANRRQQAQVEGELMSIGGNCFEDWKGPFPQIGNRVLFDKFAGFIKQEGNEEYRIISDTDILAIME
jgi:co-chaperonin GroES (HSP10)